MRHNEEEHKDEGEEEEREEGLTLLFAGLHGQSRFDVPPPFSLRVPFDLPNNDATPL